MMPRTLLFAVRGQSGPPSALRIRYHAGALGLRELVNARSRVNMIPSSLPRHVLACVGMVLPIACESVGESPANSVRSSAVTAPSCSTRVITEQQLVSDDSTIYYVTPETMVAGRHSTLIAGFPNFTSVVSPDDGKVTRIDEDSIFGLVFDNPDRAQPVALPLANQVFRGVRALTDRGGTTDRWQVVFSTAPLGGRADSDTLYSLWFGEIAEGHWVDVPLQIPVPTGTILLPRSTSSIATSSEGTLVFSILGIGRDRQRLVLQYSRDQHGWTYEVIPTFATQVSSLFLGGHAISLLLVQPDTTESTDINSLFIWDKADGTWQRGRRVSFGSVDGPAYDPIAVDLDHGTVLSWRSTSRDHEGVRGQHLNAAIVSETGEIERASIVDSALISTGSRFSPLDSHGRILWVVVHGDESGNSSTLRLVELRNRKIQVLGNFPDPYRGFVASTAMEGGSIIVSGLIHVEQKYIASLLQIWELSC
jgi:hypothetical protein